MNLSIISSFVIGGILLMMLLSVNFSMVATSSESMNDQLAKQNIDAVAQIISFDMRKVGFGLTSNRIVSIDSASFTFRGDLEHKNVINQVSWRFDYSQPNANTVNPNDYMLIRSVDGVEEPIAMGVTHFSLKYLDDKNQVTANPAQIRKIQVQLVCQGSEPVDGIYQQTAWEKIFTPLNLAL